MVTVFFSRKSAGKSTLAAQMASRLTAEDQSVLMVDADPQGTIGNWLHYRKAHKTAPNIKLLPCKDLLRLEAIVGSNKLLFDHIIVDLQGGDAKGNRQAILLADKLVIPFKPTQPDLDNIPWFHEILEDLKQLKPELEVHLVLNEAPNSKAKNSEVDQAREYFDAYCLTTADTVIHVRKAYRDSMSQGLGACELKDKKARAEVDCLWSEIYRKVRARSAKGRAPARTLKKA